MSSIQTQSVFEKMSKLTDERFERFERIEREQCEVTGVEIPDTTLVGERREREQNGVEKQHATQQEGEKVEKEQKVETGDRVQANTPQFETETKTKKQKEEKHIKFGKVEELLFNREEKIVNRRWIRSQGTLYDLKDYEHIREENENRTVAPAILLEDVHKPFTPPKGDFIKSKYIGKLAECKDTSSVVAYEKGEYVFYRGTEDYRIINAEDEIVCLSPIQRVIRRNIRKNHGTLVPKPNYKLIMNRIFHSKLSDEEYGSIVFTKSRRKFEPEMVTWDILDEAQEYQLSEEEENLIDSIDSTIEIDPEAVTRIMIALKENAKFPKAYFQEILYYVATLVNEGRKEEKVFYMMHTFLYHEYYNLISFYDGTMDQKYFENELVRVDRKYDICSHIKMILPLLDKNVASEFKYWAMCAFFQCQDNCSWFMNQFQYRGYETILVAICCIVKNMLPVICDYIEIENERRREAKEEKENADNKAIHERDDEKDNHKDTQENQEGFKKDEKEEGKENGQNDGEEVKVDAEGAINEGEDESEEEEEDYLMTFNEFFSELFENQCNMLEFFEDNYIDDESYDKDVFVFNLQNTIKYHFQKQYRLDAPPPPLNYTFHSNFNRVIQQLEYKFRRESGALPFIQQIHEVAVDGKIPKPQYSDEFRNNLVFHSIKTKANQHLALTYKPTKKLPPLSTRVENVMNAFSTKINRVHYSKKVVPEITVAVEKKNEKLTEYSSKGTSIDVSFWLQTILISMVCLGVVALPALIVFKLIILILNVLTFTYWVIYLAWHHTFIMLLLVLFVIALFIPYNDD